MGWETLPVLLNIVDPQVHAKKFALNRPSNAET
jgi:hypothetical protein